MPVRRTCEFCGHSFSYSEKDTPLTRKIAGRFCSHDCYLAQRTTSLHIRFTYHIGPTTANGCILWAGMPNDSGYGMLRIAKGKLTRAHRIAWEIANGPVPEGLGVLHHCDNPRCVNVAHLFLGTQQDNNADKIAKGRESRGERCNLSVLKEEHVRDIRRRYAVGNITMKDLAEEYGVTISNIHAIVHRRSWKHL